jgi:hypothetical protein
VYFSTAASNRHRAVRVTPVSQLNFNLTADYRLVIIGWASKALTRNRIPQ